MIAALVWSFLKPILFSWVTWAVLVAIAILLSVAHINREAGRDEVRKEVLQQEEEVGRTSSGARARVTECYVRGGNWDASTGTCS